MAEAKRKTWIIAALIALLALIAVGVWWTQRDVEPDDANGGGEAAESVEREQALQRKNAARDQARARERVAVGGRVTRADDGTGIAGAVVLLTRKGLVQGQAPSPGQPSAPLATTTDADGRWQLDSVDPGGYLLSATAEGFLPAINDEVRVIGRDSQTNLDLSMRPGGSLLSGTVSDIGGGPVEGVLIRISGTEQINLGFGNPPLAAISDENGQYRVQLATGRYAINTFHPDYVADHRTTDVREHGRREDFKLIPGATIEGVVLTGPEATPVPNARVSFVDSRSGSFGGQVTNASADGRMVMTDEQGRFRLTGVRAGIVGLTARAPGYASVAPEEVALGIAEQITGVELWVSKAYTISGYVVPKGEPEGGIEGVLVGAWKMQPPSMLVANTPTASDGYFEIHGVRPGSWQVGALSEDHLLTLSGASLTIEDQNVDDLLIELEAGVYLRGRVDPGMRARISVKVNPGSFSLTNIAGAMADALTTASTNDDGTFELGPLHPGTGFGGRELVIVAENHEGFRGQQVVQLRREDIDGLVVPMIKGASLSGTVLDSKGVPQRGVVVSVTPADPKSGGPRGMVRSSSGDAAPTGDNGKYAVRGLELGNHHVLVKDSKGRVISWADDRNNDPKTGEPKPIEINFEDTVNEQFLDLRVAPRDAEISGVVLDAEGLPVADAWVRAALHNDSEPSSRRRARRDQPERIEGVVPKDRDSGEGRAQTRMSLSGETPVLTDENGLFLIKDLRRDGDYQVIAEGERGGARATLESVAAGSRVTLTLEQLGGIDGVVTLDGKPVTEYSIEARIAGRSGPILRTKQVAHPKGEFRIDRLDPGEYELFVRADAGIGEAEVELGEAGRARVEIELERSGTLTGQVVGENDGEPLPGLSIMVTHDGGHTDMSAGIGVLFGQGPKTDADGRFELPNVSPGKGQLEFMDPATQMYGSVNIAEVEFELEPSAVEDLGVIKGLQGADVPKDERGTLQMSTRRATWAKRPRPPGTDLDAEEPNERAEADETTRLWVWSVEVGGVAEQAGVVPGDEIVRINGESVASIGVSMAANRLADSRLRVGQEVALELMRDGDPIDIRIKAVAKPG